ncbi:hypothetical protein GIS00_06705 [Nakamurella sp. YIM 132087]|uniref:DALR anticodon binding domain-containing protein n=1 Tax=Nakamurella alba TaxID=2665158 RepID=A0A7K1FHN5_9ACTN|nr:DALR anticodon-binding domain-containing protein [Nakamurella alba]MTD13632.1 hypothetical protein [Nakamurella alba]
MDAARPDDARPGSALRDRIVDEVLAGIRHSVRCVSATTARPSAAVLVKGGGDPLRILGSDATRWALLRRSPARSITLDPAVWTSYRTTNPVFAVQSAHARLSRAQAGAGVLGQTPGADSTRERVRTLVAGYRGVLADAARSAAPHRLALHLDELADATHRWLDTRLPAVRTPELTRDLGRTRHVLRHGLGLAGVTAPEYL